MKCCIAQGCLTKCFGSSDAISVPPRWPKGGGGVSGTVEIFLGLLLDRSKAPPDGKIVRHAKL